jgi:phosphomannomutase
MNENASLIVSISGIRGLVGRTLTDAVVQRFAAAFGTTLQAGDRVILARDTRPSGEGFCSQIAAALQATGCHVLDLGICPTPAAKLMVIQYQAQGAIIVTASHNPAPWNGLKLIRADGIFLNAEQGQQVETLFERQHFRRADQGSYQAIDPDHTRQRYLERIIAGVDVEAIRAASLKVAVDPCNGTGGIMLPMLLDQLGVEAVFIHAEPDGNFAHEPEPVADNLVDLGDAVRQHGCAVGFAIDPDADRVALVDEQGRAVGEDYTLALAVQAVTARRRGPVVTTLSTSQIVSDVARANDCPVVLTPVGEVNVVEKMLDEDAVIGGEGNGGVILTEVDPGRDAAVGLAIVLEALAQSGGGLSALLYAIPTYCIEKRKVDCTQEQLQAAIAAMRLAHPQAYAHPVEDGTKLYINGQLECPWIHLRPSNTEPIVRIIAESATAAQAAALCDEAEALLDGAG